MSARRKDASSPSARSSRQKKRGWLIREGKQKTALNKKRERSPWLVSSRRKEKNCHGRAFGASEDGKKFVRPQEVAADRAGRQGLDGDCRDSSATARGKKEQRRGQRKEGGTATRKDLVQRYESKGE